MPIKYICFLLSLLFVNELFACPVCHSDIGQAVRAGIMQNQFWLVMMSIVAIFLLYSVIANRISLFLMKKQICHYQLAYSGLLIGGSTIAFIDGIVFHQILQVHSMIANLLPLDSLVNVEVNMFWDGIFHVGTLMLMLAGISMLWHFFNKQRNPVSSASGFIGTFILGIGIFNLLEGIYDHLLMQLHHVLQRTTATMQLTSDWIFIGAAIVLILLGLRLLSNQSNF